MPQTMKLALLDDYQKVALRMADWDRLRKRGIEISVFHEPFKSVDDAAAKLAPFDILGLLRERTAFPKALIDRLPNLKFMVLTGARAASLDDKAAAARGIPVSTTPGGGSNALGGLGYVACAQEMQQQCFEMGLRFDRVVVGSGSSGTHGAGVSARGSSDIRRQRASSPCSGSGASPRGISNVGVWDLA